MDALITILIIIGVVLYISKRISDSTVQRTRYTTKEEDEQVKRSSTTDTTEIPRRSVFIIDPDNLHTPKVFLDPENLPDSE